MLSFQRSSADGLRAGFMCSDDLIVAIDASSTQICQDGTLQVSGLENVLITVLTNDHSLRLSKECYYGIATAVIGIKAFFAGGRINYGYPHDNVDTIDMSTRTMTSATMKAARHGIAGAALRHIAMFFGGFAVKASNPSNIVDIYNNETNTWSFTDIPRARAFGAATGVGDFILFAGGRTEGTANNAEVDIYNIVTKVWTTATLSSGRHGLAAASVGTMALFAGGSDNAKCEDSCDSDVGFSDVVDLYNSADGAWSTTKLSEARSFLAATTHGTKAFFGGGDISGAPFVSKRVDIYDAATGAWSMTDFSSARTQLVAAASGRAVLFYGGSNRDKLNMRNTIDMYDVETGVWSVDSTTSTQARRTAAGVKVGDYAIFAGGYKSSGTHTDLVEIMRLETQIQVFAQVTASSSTASISGRHQIPMRVTPLSLDLSLSTGATEATNHASDDMWNIQCNATFNGMLNQKFFLGASNPVCIATDGLCPVGKYSTGNGAVSDITNCLICPALITTDDVGQSLLTDCQCILGHTGQDTGPCTVCDAGKYKDAIGSSECTLCPAATYTDTVGAISAPLCLVCPASAGSPPGSTLLAHCVCNAGYTGPDGGACTECAAGQYKDAIGSAECALCAAGKYWGSTGATSDVCVECGSDSTSPEGSATNTDCMCDPGLTGIAHTDSCAACEPGTYKALAGSAECTICSAATYSASSGLSACTQCPTGAMSAEGSQVVADCKCGLGYTGPPGVACEACETEKYKAVDGTSPCIGCPLKSSSVPASKSLTSCLCLAGHTGDDGTVCAVCLEGDFKNSTGSAACSQCPGGSFSIQSAQTACTACAAGTFSAPSRRSCLSCPDHTTSNQAEVVEDCKCNNGYTGPDGGALPVFQPFAFC